MDKAERRQQILNHARDVFAKRGYHAAKIDDIVAAAGIARGTFYLYFEDKRAIFEEIVDRVFTRLGMTILRVDPADVGRDVGSQIEENIRRIVALLLEDKPTTKIMLSDAVGVDAAFDRKLLSFYDEVATLLEQALRDGQALGVVAPGDTRMYAYLTLGALKELLYQVVMREWEIPEPRIVDEIYGFLKRGYLRVDAEEKRAARGVR
jgi:AcrR family transcriptional regulator